MTTAQRREEILALLNQADAPIAAKDLAARFGVSRQVIVQDLAVIRASRPNIISTNRGYILFEAWGENQTTPWLIIALAIFSKPAMLAPATRLPFMP